MELSLDWVSWDFIDIDKIELLLSLLVPWLPVESVVGIVSECFTLSVDNEFSLEVV